MARKKFLTPPALPETTQCRGLVIPASQEWLGLFSEALSQTIYAYNYEQVNETDLSPEDTAALAFDIYVSWLSATCTAGCKMPGGGKVYRVSASGGYEYLDNEEWIEEELPEAPARTEPTEREKRCAAASNVVYVLHEVWEQGRQDWADEVSATDAYVDQSLAIAALIGTVFYTPVLSILALTQSGWEIVYKGYELLTSVDWDDAFNQMLVCLFLDHSTVVDDVVMFDTRAALNDLWVKAFTGQAYLLMLAQIEYMIALLPDDAINIAGSLDAVPGECDECGEWCVEWLTGQFLTHWTLAYGVVRADGNIGWGTYPLFDGASRYLQLKIDNLDTSECEITSVEVRVWKPAGSVDAYTYLAALPGVGSLTSTNDYFNWSSDSWHATPAVESSHTTSDETDLSVRVTSNSTQDWFLTGIRIRGRGTNPFDIGSNC